MGNLKERVDTILESEIDRKQFLQYSLAVFLAAFGVTNVIHTILSTDKRVAQTSKPATKETSFGYGSSRFNQ